MFYFHFSDLNFLIKPIFMPYEISIKYCSQYFLFFFCLFQNFYEQLLFINYSENLLLLFTKIYISLSPFLHPLVPLQLFTGFCRGRETLQTLCDQIPGDALLYSLFRENAEPVKCPLKGMYIFSYKSSFLIVVSHVFSWIVRSRRV